MLSGLRFWLILVRGAVLALQDTVRPRHERVWVGRALFDSISHAALK